jgi:hypothetical protein
VEPSACRSSKPKMTTVNFTGLSSGHEELSITVVVRSKGETTPQQVELAGIAKIITEFSPGHTLLRLSTERFGWQLVSSAACRMDPANAATIPADRQSRQMNGIDTGIQPRRTLQKSRRHLRAENFFLGSPKRGSVQKAHSGSSTELLVPD